MSQPDHHGAVDSLLRLHVWLLAAVIPMLDRVFPFRRLLGLLTPPTAVRPYRSVPVERVAQIVRDRLKSPRNMRRRACFRQGLTMFHFLKLAGVDAVLHFGVFAPGGSDSRMHGHCWVTVGDECFTEPPREPLAVLYRHGGE